MQPRRWPLLYAGLALVGGSVGVGFTHDEVLNPAGQIALLVLGAAFLGAFIHSDGDGKE